MRTKYIFLSVLACLYMTISAQDYYWYKGTKIHLQQGNKRYILYEDDNSFDNESQKVISDQSSQSVKLMWKIEDNITEHETKNVVYQIPSFLCYDGTQDKYITHRFFVKLVHAGDLIYLQHLAEQYHVTFKEDVDLPLWYIISCGPNSQYNALELANLFYETGLFAVSEPEFMGGIQVNCVNDPMFDEQWNLKNTGQYGDDYSGIDINYCRARAITKGHSSVIVGVYDNGVDLTHPDINLHSFSYETSTETSPSQIHAINGKVHHATACAGIIGAKANNSIGVAGIAPNCPIMSLSIDPSATTTEQIKKGYITAVNNGCSVISNSWTYLNTSSYIEAGISYALSQGRNGKGCVIVFAAGNNNSIGTAYPANCNDSIIVVGAMSPCGERKNPTSCDGEYYWGSNYGNKIDVVAPGAKIPTTDNVGVVGKTITNYMDDFNGTSAACPHVAAVAGLILSVNPYLTQKEVADIIESTARKVGSYTYSPTSGRFNGTWNNEMGYGLVDAYAAVREAENRHPIQEADYICDTTCFYLTNAPDNATFTWTMQQAFSAPGDYNIIQGQGTSSVCVEHFVLPPFPFTSISDSSTSYSVEGRDMIFPPFYINNSISVTVATQDTTYTISKILRYPIGDTPEVSVSDSSYYWTSSEKRTFTVSNCTTEPDTVFYWEMKRENVTEYTHVGRTFSHKPATFGNYTVSVTNTEKECGNQTTSLFFRVVRRPPLLIATANQGVLNVTISEEDSQKGQSPLLKDADYTLELWHNIYGQMKEKEVHSTKEQIDISNLPKGVYVLLLKENGNIVAQTKVQL